MKKMIVAAAIVCIAALTQAATVAWSAAGMNNYAGDKYQMFIIGQKGVESMAMITSLLDSGTAVDSYAIGGGTVAANGSALNSNSGYTVGEGTYSAFFVLFDSANPGDGSKYVTISGAPNMT